MQTLSKPPPVRTRVARYVADLWERREFLRYLVVGNLKARNASTTLGLLWWVLNPLLLGGVYFLVFGVIIARDARGPDFLAYLLSGMFVFHFTGHSLTGGANSILQNSKLLSNLRFPRLILPLSAVLESMVGFVASLAVFYAITLPFGQSAITPSLVLLLVALPIQLVFNLGLASLSARLAVPFRDINNLLPYINRIWLYLSPIIWPLTLLEGQSETIQQLVRLNPMFDLISVYRAALLGWELAPADLIAAALWALLAVVIGVGSFVRFEGRMVRYL